MKKKIKDLTLEEKATFCEKYQDCKICPLFLFMTSWGYVQCFSPKNKIDDIYPVDYLNKEIEIDESNNENN